MRKDQLKVTSPPSPKKEKLEKGAVAHSYIPLTCGMQGITVIQ
jgi:hypothetical protein